MLTTIHVIAIFFSVGVILWADKEGFSWLSGKKPVLKPERLRFLHALTWTGLGVLMVTGVFLLIPRAGYLLAQPLFIIKLLFVAILVVNAVLIGRLMHIAAVKPFAALTLEEKLSLFTSGIVSFFSWGGAIVSALSFFSIFPF